MVSYDLREIALVVGRYFCLNSYKLMVQAFLESCLFDLFSEKQYPVRVSKPTKTNLVT